MKSGFLVLVHQAHCVQRQSTEAPALRVSEIVERIRGCRRLVLPQASLDALYDDGADTPSVHPFCIARDANYRSDRNLPFASDGCAPVNWITLHWKICRYFV